MALPAQLETLVEKLSALPDERVAEVEDFVDFLHQRAEDRSLTRAASRLAEDAFREIWDNPEDAVYDRL